MNQINIHRFNEIVNLLQVQDEFDDFVKKAQLRIDKFLDSPKFSVPKNGVHKIEGE